MISKILVSGMILLKLLILKLLVLKILRLVIYLLKKFVLKMLGLFKNINIESASIGYFYIRDAWLRDVCTKNDYIISAIKHNSCITGC